MVHKVVTQLLPFLVEIDSVRLAEINPKDHRVGDLQELAKSLDTFGQRKPIVVNINTMEIEAGNGTYLAAKDYLGWTHIAAICLDDTNENHLSYSIADNRTSELSSWNYDNMSIILGIIDNVNVPGVDSSFLLKIKPVNKNQELVKPDVPTLNNFLDNFNMNSDTTKEYNKIIELEVKQEDYYTVYNCIMDSLSNLDVEVKIR